MKLIWALLSFPYLIFLVPILGTALHGAKNTAYDQMGNLVPKLTDALIKRKRVVDAEEESMAQAEMADMTLTPTTRHLAAERVQRQYREWLSARWTPCFEHHAARCTPQRPHCNRTPRSPSHATCRHVPPARLNATLSSVCAQGRASVLLATCSLSPRLWDSSCRPTPSRAGSEQRNTFHARCRAFSHTNAAFESINSVNQRAKRKTLQQPPICLEAPVV